jgi:hypothetical protein
VKFLLLLTGGKWMLIMKTKLLVRLEDVSEGTRESSAAASRLLDSKHGVEAQIGTVGTVDCSISPHVIRFAATVMQQNVLLVLAREKAVARC